MAYYICVTCGVQYECTLEEPRECIICKEERQFINPNGQKWTTLERLVKSEKYHNHIRAEEENLYSIV